jgi:hypothetical protein
VAVEVVVEHKEHKVVVVAQVLLYFKLALLLLHKVIHCQ